MAQTQVKMVKVIADNWSKVESSPAQSSAKAKMGTPVALLLRRDDRMYYLGAGRGADDIDLVCDDDDFSELMRTGVRMQRKDLSRR